MGKKRKTTEEFIAEARKVHGGRYGYGSVIYTTNKGKVTIRCPEHGDFQQRACAHIMGQGCSQCHNIAKWLNTEYFVKRAVAIHGSKYKYGKVIYTGSREKVIITCLKHGDFEQTAGSHLRGVGCTKCKVDSQRSDTESFVKRAVELHGGKWDYKKTVYRTIRKRVTITCPEHGDFEQTPDNHLQGTGCPKCSDKWSGDGVVYVMSTPEGYNKIGIAKSGTEHNRLQQILKSQQNKSPTAITGLSLVCAYSFNDGSFTEARKFEGKAHRHFKLRRKVFTDKFDGSGEFFNVTITEICSYLEQQGGKLVTVKGAP